MNVRAEDERVELGSGHRDIAIDADVVSDFDVFKTDDRAVLGDANVGTDAFEPKRAKFVLVVVAMFKGFAHLFIHENLNSGNNCAGFWHESAELAI